MHALKAGRLPLISYRFVLLQLDGIFRKAILKVRLHIESSTSRSEGTNLDKNRRLPRFGPWRERSSNESLLAGMRVGPSIHLLTTYAITDPRTEPYQCYQNLLANTGYRKGFSWWVEISSLLLKVKNGVWLLVLVLKQSIGRWHMLPVSLCGFDLSFRKWELQSTL